MKFAENLKKKVDNKPLPPPPKQLEMKKPEKKAEGALTLDKLWLEIQAMKRNKVEMTDYQKLLKRLGGEGSDDIVQLKTNRNREGSKLPGVVVTQQTKNVKPTQLGTNLYTSIAAHFTMQLQKYNKDDSADGSDRNNSQEQSTRNYQPWYKCERCRHGGTCSTKELEESLKDIKQAIVDLATGVKECKDRITALEENRRLDLTQINDKWNVQVRKLNKIEKTVNLIQRQAIQSSKKQQTTIVKISKGDPTLGGGTGGANESLEPFGTKTSIAESTDEQDDQSNYDRFIGGRSSHGSQASNNNRNDLKDYEQSSIQAILAQT